MGASLTPCHIMACSAIYFLDNKGKVLLCRNYRGDIDNNVIENFISLVNDVEDESLARPLIKTQECTFAYIKTSNIYIVATSRTNSNVALLFSLLYKIRQVMVEYFTQEGYKLDIGAPKPPPAVTNAVSWRDPEGIKYRKNEVFLDVIESVDLLAGAQGNVLRSEIRGNIKMRVYLSGMPELRLGLNDKVLFESTGRGKSKSVELEDVKFHQCVRLSRFDNDRTISFIPPDGEFELMSYRLNTHVKPLIWIESVIERHAHSRIEYMVKAKSQFKRRSTANNVEIIIPVPNDADGPKFKTTIGHCKYAPEQSAVIWSIKSFPGGKEYLMRAHFNLPSVSGELTEGKPPIQVKFEIPYFTTSGIQVRYLKIIEKSGYQALPWVRYITQNGDYQLRTS